MKNVKFKKENLPIVLILILSAVLNFANLTIEGYGNEYYAAGVKSMLVNLKNFFFVSFDPAGFVSIDKPPLGFWIQTISAKIFGFSGWSIILPQALAGVISVGLIYYIVKRSFGNIAGTISALCLAITPVFVAASRNNTIDNLLVMVLLIACVFISKAAEKGRFKYIIISLVLIGVGFNIKMLQAYMIIPAVYVVYLISRAVPVKKRIKHLALGTVVLVVVSLSWAVIVDLVPAQYRPYVGSSTNNTVMELILGHNGLERFNNSGMGGRQAPGEFRNTNIYGTQNQRGNGNAQNGNWTNRQKTAEDSQNGNMANFSGGNGNVPEGMKLPEGSSGGRGAQGGGMAGNFGGQTEASITRLFSKNVLSDQIVWFLPLAIFGFIAGAIVEKLKFTFDNRKKLDLILWIFWLIPEFLYFSYTKGLFHQYYLTMMAPPIAALSGIGLVSMWKLYKEKSKNITWLLLPVSLVANGLVQLLMLSYYSNISSAIKAIIISSLVLCFISSTLLIVYKVVKKGNLEKAGNIKLGKALTILAFVGILITPAIGSGAAINHKVNGTMPSAGLELLSNNESGNFMMGRGSGGSGNDKLVKFLEKNITNEKYILVVSSATSAQDIILQTGKGVMALGGFTGSDKILTLDEFKTMVKNGEVRYVLTGGMGRGSMDDIMNWVQKNGKAVSESQWRNTVESQEEKGYSDFNVTEYDKNTDTKYNYKNDNSGNNSGNNSGGGPEGMNSQVLYDLKGSVK
ncbi:glycosyltransferase family 39 protein [Clostridium kluyveri]|uniref:Dolichyl-phosphate-mannose--protein mannosyltransferase n=1 Tax=Clostridium kluyveri TaxID=1534 RepID=A0A1L5F4T9_CLOKL|nr:glycosyltransferase family 39 protein [Clostridium kluyveri]APM38036.1 dolichyl-phosphate-mannose--protein mannosyltransferase [Clostridium kluyveri]